MRYAFIFICQRGALELKALLLAASLRRFLRVDHELVAAVPAPEAVWGRPADATLALLARWGVRCVPVVNPIGPEYPIGNKLACLDVPTDADKVVFLDSDMLCLREFGHMPRFERAFNAKPADFATYAADAAAWSQAYASVGISAATTRMAATVSGELMPPYFNAGFIAVRRAAGLGAEWTRTAQALEADPRVLNKRPWLDQVALPLAVAKLGLAADCLDERFNYPAHLKPLNPEALPWFCHYHAPAVLRREPLANAVVMELAAAEPLLGDRLAASPEWRSLLQPYVLPPRKTGWRDHFRPASSPASDCRTAAAAPDLLITGLPRSGTSYLCSLLNRQADCAVINEPAGIFAPLAQQATPYGLLIIYRDFRQRILDGHAVENKLHNGEFIEDTAVVDKLELWSPAVTRPDFLLATKNTLAYLARLPQLRRALPQAVIAACVRHPLDTIASWKTSFSHLAAADLEAQAVGHSRDPLLSGAQRRRLEEVAATTSPALRRALLWRHLAELILENRSRLILLRYEDMVADPTAALNQLFTSMPTASRPILSASVAASSARFKREVLDDADLAAIRGICGQAAAELGYDTI